MLEVNCNVIDRIYNISITKDEQKTFLFELINVMLPINLTAEKYVYQNESYIAVGVLGTRPLGILDVAAGKRNSNK